MIAKLAKFRLPGRARKERLDPAAAPCNDNRPARRVVRLGQPRRVLLCDWHRTAKGTLESRWHVGVAADSAAEEPIPQRRSGLPQPILQNVA